MQRETKSLEPKRRWYVLKCKRHEDGRALEHLERQGFECYGPMRRVEKLRHGRRVHVSEPLFPQYLFIRLDDLNDNWYPIRSTRGVNHLVRFGEEPLPVRDDIVEELRQRLCADPSPVPFLQPGERVRITAGPFSEVEGIFLAADGEERVMLLLRILHRDQQVSFPVSTVRKCGSL